MNEDHPTHVLFYGVQDPTAPLAQCPAITTLLFRVCDRDNAKFEEATRLISLFMEAAYELGKNENKKSYKDLPELAQEIINHSTDMNKDGLEWRLRKLLSLNNE